MDKIGSGKWTIWMAALLFGTTLLGDVTTQPAGFLNINCGGKANQRAENNITWVNHANYIGVGQTVEIGNATEQSSGSYLNNLRLFPKPLHKSCYQVPLAWFFPGNYSGFQQFPSFSYSIETLGVLHTQDLTTTNRYSPDNCEGILVSSGALLCICLIRTSETDDPFINVIELRTLGDGMHAEAKPGTMLILGQRLDFGGISTVGFLENNHLIRPLPNFSSLTMLETSFSSKIKNYVFSNIELIQDASSLCRTAIYWLSEVKTLKELNNNFSGVIRAQLLNRSLKLIHYENPYLCMHKGECILPNSNKNKMRVVVGVTLGGILIIDVALTVGIVVYRKKFRRKVSVAERSSGMKTNQNI